MIVDIHSHIWPEVGAIPRRHVWATAVHWGCVRLPGEPRDPNLIVDRIAPGWVDPQAEYNLKNNAEAGIDVAVLNTIDYGLSMGEEQEFTIEQLLNGSHLFRRNTQASSSRSLLPTPVEQGH